MKKLRALYAAACVLAASPVFASDGASCLSLFAGGEASLSSSPLSRDRDSLVNELISLLESPDLRVSSRDKGRELLRQNPLLKWLDADDRTLDAIRNSNILRFKGHDLLRSRIAQAFITAQGQSFSSNGLAPYLTVAPQLKDARIFMTNLKLISFTGTRWKSEEVAYYFARTPFARRMGIPSETIQRLFEEMRDAQSPEEMDQAIAKHLPELASGSERLTRRYFREVPVERIRTQHWGDCWANAGTAFFEVLYRVLTGKEIELSNERIFYQSLSSRLHAIAADLPTLRKLVEKKRLTFEDLGVEGDYIHRFPGLVLKYGLQTAAEWQPKVPLSVAKEALPGQVLQVLKDFIAGTPEEQLSWPQVRDYTLSFPLRQLVQKYSGSLHDSTSDPLREQIFGSADEFLALTNGKLNFRQFPQGEEYLKAKLDVPETPLQVSTTDEMLERIRAEIDRGLPVGLGYEHYEAPMKDFHTRLDVNTPSGELDNTFGWGEYSDGHAVLVVGYELDFQGRVCGLKVLNSGGKNSGDDGFFHMSRKYFESTATAILVYNGKRIP